MTSQGSTRIRSPLKLPCDYMDWKELLAKKVESGELPHEDSTPSESEKAEKGHSDLLRITIDRKGRKGKTATIIDGFTCPDPEIAEIASKLKAGLGAGGSARGGEILIQGDVADKLKPLLIKMGYRVK